MQNLNIPNNVFHTTAGYLELCIDTIPDIIGNMSRWESLTTWDKNKTNEFYKNNFKEIANQCSQMYKQYSNHMRKWFYQEACKNEPHPGSVEGGGDGDFKNPSPIEIEILLNALKNNTSQNWNTNDKDEDDDDFEVNI